MPLRVPAIPYRPQRRSSVRQFAAYARLAARSPPPATRLPAAEKRDELSPVHCPVPPVLSTERIAHLVRQEPAALPEFAPPYDRSESFRSTRRARQRHVRSNPDSSPNLRTASTRRGVPTKGET